MRNCTIALALVLFAFLSAVSARSESDKGVQAFTGDSSQQVAITADKAEGRSLPRGYETIFTGNVKVRQADMTLTCHRLIIVYEQKEGSKSRSGSLKVPMGNGMNSENLRTITALGHVEIVQRDTKAMAGKAVYNRGKRTVTLTESPRLRQGSNTLQANAIIISLEENHVDFKGGNHSIKPKSRSGNLKVPVGTGMNSENLRTITALGHVEIIQRDTKATAGKAVYDHSKRTVTLTESPRLRQGSNVLEAKSIIIYLDENRVDFEGGSQGIKGTLNPGNYKKQEKP